MAKDIQSPTVSQALQQAFRLQGRVRPSLDEIIVPTISVGAVGQGVTPGVSFKAAGRVSVAAGGAGTNSQMRLECPGSILLRLDRVIMAAGATGAFFFGLGATFPTDPTTQGNHQFLDGRLRQGLGLEPAGVVLGDSAAAAGPTGAPVRIPYLSTAGAVTWTPNNLIVASGDPNNFAFLECSFGTNNTATDVYFEWTEFAWQS